MGRLTGIDTVLLLDLDGTLYVGSQVVPGAPETVRWLRAQGLTVQFTTNTDSIPPTALADRLAGPGERATHVLVADPSYGATYDDLNAAFRALRSEAQLVTTQVNRIARRDDGEHPDTGGWLRLLEYATGRTAGVLGKPSPEFLTAPPNALGRGAQSALVVGDDLAADIGGGHAVGAAARATAPSQAPGPSRTQWSTASPTCPDCSKTECIRPAPQWAREGETPMATDNTIRSFTLDVDELGWTGQDLQRPESVVAEPDGTLWASDGRGGVTRIDPDGGQALLGGWGGEPNGLAIDPDGNLVTANIGLGRVQRMTRDGQASTVLEEVDGQRTTSANFVFYDRSGRLWLTCLTREDHWWPAVADARPDGFIVLVDDRGARIVADGIYATNEARLDAEERYLYVAETMKARILRFPVRSDGSLGEREVFGPDGLGLGGFVDGFAFDAEGNLWVTTVVRNGIGVLTRDGDWHVVLEDPREDVLAGFVDKLAAGAATPEDMLAAAGPRLQFPTSVCFAGPDLRTAYVGSLAMSRLPTFRAPVPGLPMSHWS